MPILSNPSVQFIITAVLGFLAVLTTVFCGFIAIVVYRKQRTHKEITYEIDTDSEVVSIDEDVKDRIKIQLDGNTVDDVSLVVLKVWNSGNIAIRPSDYFDMIKFEFEGRTVEGIDILNTKPEELISSKEVKELLTSSKDAVQLPNVALNPNEEVTLKLLLTGLKGEVKIRGRIADGKIKENIVSNPTTATIWVPNILVICSFLFNLLLVTISILAFLYINSQNTQISQMQQQNSQLSSSSNTRGVINANLPMGCIKCDQPKYVVSLTQFAYLEVAPTISGGYAPSSILELILNNGTGEEFTKAILTISIKRPSGGVNKLVFIGSAYGQPGYTRFGVSDANGLDLSQTGTYVINVVINNQGNWSNNYQMMLGL